MACVVLEGVSKVFRDGILAVSNLNLVVNDKELLVLVGPSGCGKSTTLRMIAGLESVSQGTIHIGNRNVNNIPPHKRDVALVFQNYALYPHMTVYENMAFGLKLRCRESWVWENWFKRFEKKRSQSSENHLFTKNHGEIIKKQVSQAARLLEVDHLLDRKPHQLSGGERQRVALGRAIVKEPAVFLFDEPLSNLDLRLRTKMRRELKQLHRKLETTVIYVTHDQAEALALGETIAVMNQGNIIQTGSPMAIYDYPRNRFVAGFLGDPPMNFIEGRLNQQNDRWWFACGNFRVNLTPELKTKLLPQSREPIVLGIRPEHVHATKEKSTPQDNCRQAKVTSTEPSGDASILHLELTGCGRDKNNPTLMSKTRYRTTLRPGEEVFVRFPCEQTHFFSQGSGENLTLPKR